MDTQSFIELCQDNRAVIEGLKKSVKNSMSHPECQKGSLEANPYDTDEIKANLMLVYRHLEDARMRLGKAIQARDGGKSVYPK